MGKFSFRIIVRISFPCPCIKVKLWKPMQLNYWVAAMLINLPFLTYLSTLKSGENYKNREFISQSLILKFGYFVQLWIFKNKVWHCSHWTTDIQTFGCKLLFWCSLIFVLARNFTTFLLCFFITLVMTQFDIRLEKNIQLRESIRLTLSQRGRGGAIDRGQYLNYLLIIHVFNKAFYIAIILKSYI